MDAIKIFSNPQFGKIRTMLDFKTGEILFCANDVTNALGYSNGRSAVSRHVDTPDVVKRDMGVVTGEKTDGSEALQLVNTTFVTESGLYSLIFGSKQERAKQFKRWVTSEVLPSIRKSGQYSCNHSSSPSLTEQVNVNLAFADWSIKQFNLNEASKLGWARTIGDKFGLVTDALPKAVNAGTANPTTHSATDLLKRHNVGLSARAFNKVLELRGVVKAASRPGRYGKVHTWFVLLPQYDRFGENQQNPQYQQQTQIRWYDATFDELLVIVGLSRQQTLQL